MDNRGHSRQVPSFNDAFGGRDRLPSDMFGDVRRQLHDNVWGQTGMDWPSHGFGDHLGSIGQHFPDDFDNLRRRFHDLKPRSPAKEEFGSSDSLDGDSARSLIIEDTHNKSRTFEVSFNVREYIARDITVCVTGHKVMVTAQQVDQRDSRRTRHFSRQVTLPTEVEPGVLSAVLSGDGILTLYAPLPPTYGNIVFCRDQSGVPGPSRTDHPDKGGSSTTSVAAEDRCSPSNGPTTPRMQSSDGSVPSDYRTASPTNPTRFTNSPGSSEGSVPSGHRAASPSNPTRFTNSPGSSEGPRSPYQAGFIHPNYPRRTFSDSLDRNDRRSDIVGEPRSPHPRAGVTDESQKEQPMYTEHNGQRRMTLRVNIGPGYVPDDIVVNVDDLKMTVNAVHEDNRSGGVSKTSMSRQFDMRERIDSDSVEANLSGGVLTIVAVVIMSPQ